MKMERVKGEIEGREEEQKGNEAERRGGVTEFSG